MSFGVDYAFKPHPPVQAMVDAGVKFACRYTSAMSVNDANGKNLLPGECKALLKAGISVVVVAEEGAQRMRGGKSIGTTDAQHADAVVSSLGMPGLPIYFACDYDAPESDQNLINAYLTGAASVIGLGRVGIYGGYWPVSRARTAGKATYFCGTIAWSGNNWNTATWTPHIMQGLQVKVGTISVDVDHSHGQDYGQWPRPADPPPPPPEGPPYRQTATGLKSLFQVARDRGTTVEHLIELSAHAYTDKDKAILGGKRLRRGTPYYTSNP